MLGRLIDQLFHVHVHEPSEASLISSFLNSNPLLKQYVPESPWGNTLPLFQSADSNIINLETSVTTSSKKWPEKVFNYRMHPENISALRSAKISYASLANNHTLDFSGDGFKDTVDALYRSGVAFAGAGLSQQEASAPAVVELAKVTEDAGDSKSSVLKIWSAADHPSDWSTVPGFSFIDYSSKTRERIKKLILESSKAGSDQQFQSLKVFSIHWGPNYSWQPSDAIQSLAHFLVDECGIDVVHGHSSHHIQGVEIYKSKFIMYGCGDFIDDYALTPEYRNDLSAVWRVNVVEDGARLKLDKLEVFPTRIKTFQAQRLTTDESDFAWLKGKLTALCAELGTRVERDVGDDGQLMIKV